MGFTSCRRVALVLVGCLSQEPLPPLGGPTMPLDSKRPTTLQEWCIFLKEFVPLAHRVFGLRRTLKLVWLLKKGDHPRFQPQK